MNDISGNENIIEDVIDISENDISASNPHENDETIETVLYTDNTIDYTSHFENLETIGIFISALLAAYGIAFSFFKGFKR